jgi:hypothetical protein
MERLISLWKAHVNIFGTFAVNWLDWGSLLRQSDVPEDILSSKKVDELLKLTSTIDSSIKKVKEAMAIGDSDYLSMLGIPYDGLAPAQQIQQVKQAYQAQQAQMNSILGQQAQQCKPDVNPRIQINLLNQRAYELLALRLGGVKRTFKLGAEDFLVCHCTIDTVFIFFVFNGKSGCTQEQTDIFPSDKLITQLKLIMSS